MNLEAVYPDPTNPAVELCFEELRAAKRGWLHRDWTVCRKNAGLGAASSKTATEAFPEVMENIDRANVERVQPSFDIPRKQDNADVSVSTHEAAPTPATQKQQHREKLSVLHDCDESAAPKVETECVARPESEKLKVLRENDIDITTPRPTHTEDSHRQEKLQVLGSNKLSVSSEMPIEKQEKFAVFSGNDENAPPESIAPPKSIAPQKDDLTRRLRKEERANRTRKIKLREETQTGN